MKHKIILVNCPCNKFADKMQNFFLDKKKHFDFETINLNDIQEKKNNLDDFLISRMISFELTKSAVYRYNFGLLFNYKRIFSIANRSSEFCTKKIEQADLILIFEAKHLLSQIFIELCRLHKKECFIISKTIQNEVNLCRIITKEGLEIEVSFENILNNNQDINAILKDTQDVKYNDIKKTDNFIENKKGMITRLKEQMKYSGIFYGLLNSFKSSLMFKISNYRKNKYGKFIEIDKNKKYVTLFLQTTYDSHNLLSKITYDQIIQKLIDETDHQIIIKEHPEQHYEYKIDEKLKKHKRVTWISKYDRIDFLGLLLNSEFNVVINSTCGIESVYLDKPTFVFDNAFYYNYTYASYDYNNITFKEYIKRKEDLEKEYSLKRLNYRKGYYKYFISQNGTQDYIFNFFSNCNNLYSLVLKSKNKTLFDIASKTF